MKVLVVLSGLVCLALSEAPYQPSGWKPSGALLVLPSKQQSSFARQNAKQQQVPVAYGAPAQPDNQGAENGADSVNNVEGEQTGSYYVLLPDGRLQKIQYKAGSLKPQNGATGDVQTKQNFKQQQFQLNKFQSQSQFERQNSQFAQNGFSRGNPGFVLTASNVNNFEKFNANQQLNNGFGQSHDGQATNSVNTFQKFGNQQFNRQDFNEQSVHKSATKTPNQLDEAAVANKLVAQFSQAHLQTNGPAPDGLVASVQFSDVPPIMAPVYSFNPAPLVRVLRMIP